jgi:AraC-like DNA-binding protein
MYQHFCTTDVPVGEAAEFWCSAISKAYFDLQLHFQTVQQFRAQLDVWSLGLVSLSRLESSALHYSRRPQKPPTDRSSQQPQLLLTVPLNSSVEFTQLGRHTRCEPGQFVLEHGHEPYEFSHSAHNTMWVLKIPEAALQARTGPTDRFCALPFRSDQGVGKLFSDYLQLSMRHCGVDQSPQALMLMGQQLLDLLALTLQESPSVLHSNLSVVQNAHLARVEAYARQHLHDASLSLSTLAQVNGISLRYLHSLFVGTPYTAAQWLRELRLQKAYELLQTAPSHTTVAHIAYACGFSDQAQFSHAFKRRHGLSPMALRRGIQGKT